jgi:uncharacterized membrane protein YgcG
MVMLSGEDMECTRHAAEALRCLARNQSLVQVIVDAGAVTPLVAMLSGGDAKCKTWALGALTNLTGRGISGQLIIDAGALVPLVAMLSGDDLTCKQQAAAALWNLATDSSVGQLIVDAGAVAPLVAMLNGDDINCKKSASGGLHLLCKIPDVVFGDAVPALVANLGSSNEPVRKQCSHALQSLALSKFEHLHTGTIQQLRAIIPAASSQPEGEAVTALATKHLRGVLLKRGEIGRALSFGLSRCSNAGVCAIGVGVMFSCGTEDDEPTPIQLAQPGVRSQLEPMLVQLLSSTGGDNNNGGSSGSSSGSSGSGGSGSSSSTSSSSSSTIISSAQVQAANAMGHVLDVAAWSCSVVLPVPPTGWEDHSRMLEDDTLADLKFKVGGTRIICHALLLLTYIAPSAAYTYIAPSAAYLYRPFCLLILLSAACCCSLLLSQGGWQRDLWAQAHPLPPLGLLQEGGGGADEGADVERDRNQGVPPPCF